MGQNFETPFSNTVQALVNLVHRNDHLTLLQKVCDGIGSDVGNAVLHVEEDFAITGKTIHVASKRIKVMVVNYFTSILLLSFLLPITYLLICYRFIKINFPLEVARANNFTQHFWAKKNIMKGKQKEEKATESTDLN